MQLPLVSSLVWHRSSTEEAETPCMCTILTLKLWEALLPLGDGDNTWLLQLGRFTFPSLTTHLCRFPYINHASPFIPTLTVCCKTPLHAAMNHHLCDTKPRFTHLLLPEQRFSRAFFRDFHPKIAPSTIPALVPLKGISEAAHKSQTQKPGSRKALV